jgi:hypothetical protein
LAEALRDRGHRVFFDEFELVAGSHLTSTINAGLERARRGVVILSPAFFSKRWPKQELENLTKREISTGKDLIIPVWHSADEIDVAQFSPALADRYAIDSAKGLDAIVVGIEQALQPRQRAAVGSRWRHLGEVLARRTRHWLARPPGPAATLAILVIGGIATFV